MNTPKPNPFPFSPANNAHLRVGERVICAETTEFCNGEKHYKGKIYTVEPDTSAYFSLFTGIHRGCRYFRIDDVK